LPDGRLMTWILITLGTLATVVGVALSGWVLWDKRRLAVRVTAWTDEGPALSFAVEHRPVASVANSIVRVRVINRGRGVAIERVGWVDPTVEARADHLDFRGVKPTTLARDDAATFQEPLETFGDANLGEPQTFYVALLTGETLFTKGIRVDRPVAEGRQKPVPAKPRSSHHPYPRSR
jgi:hypothetical protein